MNYIEAFIDIGLVLLIAAAFDKTDLIGDKLQIGLISSTDGSKSLTISGKVWVALQQVPNYM